MPNLNKKHNRIKKISKKVHKNNQMKMTQTKINKQASYKKW